VTVKQASLRHECHSCFGSHRIGFLPKMSLPQHFPHRNDASGRTGFNPAITWLDTQPACLGAGLKTKNILEHILFCQVADIRLQTDHDARIGFAVVFGGKTDLGRHFHDQPIPVKALPIANPKL